MAKAGTRVEGASSAGAVRCPPAHWVLADGRAVPRGFQGLVWVNILLRCSHFSFQSTAVPDRIKNSNFLFELIE